MSILEINNRESLSKNTHKNNKPVINSKEPNGNFSTKKYNNQTKKLSEWIQQHNGRNRGGNSELEYRIILITQSEHERKTLRKVNKAQGSMKLYSIRSDIHEAQEKYCDAKKVLEEVTAENFPHFAKDINI